jgi:uncharacterized membrane protein
MSDSFLPAGRSVEIGRGFNWISDAFGLFSRSALGWIAFTIIFLIIMIAFSAVPFLGQFLFSLILPLILAGAIVASHKLDRHESIKPEDFMVGYVEKPVPLLIVGAIYMAGTLLITLAFVLILFATLGTVLMSAIIDPHRLHELLTFKTGTTLLLALLATLLLYVPLLMTVWFAVPLVYFHDISPVDAMKKSFVICLRNTMPFLLFGLVAITPAVLLLLPTLLAAAGAAGGGVPVALALLGLLGLLPVIFLAVPITIITIYTSYRDVFFDRSASPPILR